MPAARGRLQASELAGQLCPAAVPRPASGFMPAVYHDNLLPPIDCTAVLQPDLRLSSVQRLLTSQKYFHSRASGK